MPIRVFQRDDDVVYWGDALEALQSIPAESIDLVFADPPYNIGKQFGDFVDSWPSDEAYLQWCYQWLSLCIEKLKPSGSMYVMASTQSVPLIDVYLRSRIYILSRIVWCYDSSGVQARRHFGSAYEPILFCVKDRKNYTFNADMIQIEAKTGAQRQLIDYRKTEPTLYSATKTPSNVWTYPRVRYRMSEYENHPTQKPEKLLERIVLASSREGDVVLDPFSGTFTTSAVAQRLNRRTIGIELQKAYVMIGLRRLRIQDELDGEPLAAPEKSFRRKDRSPDVNEPLF